MKMKKFLAVVLSFVLSFSLAMPTFAQDNTASAAQAVQSEVTETSNDENVSADENTSKDASAETVKEDSKTEASKTDEKAEDASENAEVKKEVTKTTKTDKKQADSDASASDIDTSVWTAEDFTYTEMSQTLNGYKAGKSTRDIRMHYRRKWQIADGTSGRSKLHGYS